MLVAKSAQFRFCVVFYNFCKISYIKLLYFHTKQRTGSFKNVSSTCYQCKEENHWRVHRNKNKLWIALAVTEGSVRFKACWILSTISYSIGSNTACKMWFRYVSFMQYLRLVVSLFHLEILCKFSIYSFIFSNMCLTALFFWSNQFLSVMAYKDLCDNICCSSF